MTTYTTSDRKMFEIEIEPDGAWITTTGSYTSGGVGERTLRSWLSEEDVADIRGFATSDVRGVEILMGDEVPPPVGVSRRSDGSFELRHHRWSQGEPDRVRGAVSLLLDETTLQGLLDEFAQVSDRRGNWEDGTSTRVGVDSIMARSDGTGIVLEFNGIVDDNDPNYAPLQVSDTSGDRRWLYLAQYLRAFSEDDRSIASDVEKPVWHLAGESEAGPSIKISTAPGGEVEGQVYLEILDLKDERIYKGNLRPADVETFVGSLDDAGLLDQASPEQTTDASLDFSPRDALLEASRISSSFDRLGMMTLNLGAVDPQTEQVQWETLTSASLHPDELDDLAAALREPDGQRFEFRTFDSEADTTGLVLRVDRAPSDLEGARGSDVRLRLLEESDGTGNEDSMDVLFDGVVTDDVAEELAADSEFAASVDDARTGSSQGFADADTQQAERAHRMVAKPATVAAKQPSVDVQARQEYAADPMRNAALAQPGQAAGLAGPA